MDVSRKKLKTTRSRTGCLTCRKRKKKCDELLYPVCQNCECKNLQCSWPPIKLDLHKKLEEVKYTDSSSVTSSSVLTSYEKSSVLGEHSSMEPGSINLKELNNTFEMDYLATSASRNNIDLVNLSASSEFGSPTGSTTLHTRVIPKIRRPDQSETSGVKFGHLKWTLGHLIDKKKSSRSFSGSVRPHGYFLERIAMQQDCVETEDSVKDFDVDPLVEFSDQTQSPQSLTRSFLDPSLYPDYQFDLLSGKAGLVAGIPIITQSTSNLATPTSFSPRSLNPTISIESNCAKLNLKSPTPETSTNR